MFTADCPWERKSNEILHFADIKDKNTSVIIQLLMHSKKVKSKNFRGLLTLWGAMQNIEGDGTMDFILCIDCNGKWDSSLCQLFHCLSWRELLG